MFALFSMTITGKEPIADTQPTMIDTAELVEYATLAAPRRRLIETALAVGRDSPWLKYLPGSADPGAGGFDCSGAMVFVMHKVGLEPPRSSAAQFEWIRKNGNLHEVSADASGWPHPSLAQLLPGDLLFWSITTTPPDGPAVTVIHHVAMYLGTRKSDGGRVMINSSEGRSYLGRKLNGYGVCDFRIPKPGSISRLAGYGPPPGMGSQ